MHELQTTARELDATPVLVTFSPHTLKVVRPDIELQCLTTLEEKLALAKQYAGIAESIVIDFTSQMAQMTATEFLDALCAPFSVKGLVVGVNFSLGHNRTGNAAFLEEYGRTHDIVVRLLPLKELEGTRISSTRIRALVAEGEVREAAELLGHPVRVSGRVEHGYRRGRQIGFPTANLLPEPAKLLPANGVYAARVRIEKDSETQQRDGDPGSDVYTGAVNIGVRPTFDGQVRLVEAYLLDVDLDLYDRRLTIDFVDRLRGEQRFAGIEALKAQIATDVQQARQILQQGA